MEMWLTTGEDVAGQEHLADDEFVGRERLRIAFDELALTNRRCRLESRNVIGTLDDAECRKPGCHCTRTHQHRWMAGPVKPCDLGDDPIDGVGVDQATAGGQAGGSYLDDDRKPRFD